MSPLAALASLVDQGEGATLELKRSTAELRRAGASLCAFLNGEGGRVVIGVTPDGRIVGQQVSDLTLRDLAAMLGRLEPPAHIEIERIDLEAQRAVFVLVAPSAQESAPFLFEGRAYRRIGSTNTVMPQGEYARLLLARNHSRMRWENQPALGVRLEDLDHEEILRTRQIAIEQRRLSAGTSMDPGDILDRLGLRVGAELTQAAQMLYGTRFLPDYPQALLKLGRFRGSKITGDILDNKQEHLHAFAMVREAIAWLDRTLPLAAHFPQGRIERVDRLPVPAEALREVLLNAIIHRDFSRASSYVAVAVFDNRIEVRSVGDFPEGIRAEMLSGEHPSIRRNPSIAGAFHRTGAVEVWGRGTNRVIEACEAHSIAPPEFKQEGGVVTVTFRVTVASAEASVPSLSQVRPKSVLSESQVRILEFATVPRSLSELMATIGSSNRTRFRDQLLTPLLNAQLLERTIPEKPRSSKQMYRTTEAGRRDLERPR